METTQETTVTLHQPETLEELRALVESDTRELGDWYAVCSNSMRCILVRAFEADPRNAGIAYISVVPRLWAPGMVTYQVPNGSQHEDYLSDELNRIANRFDQVAGWCEGVSKEKCLAFLDQLIAERVS